MDLEKARSKVQKLIARANDNANENESRTSHLAIGKLVAAHPELVAGSAVASVAGRATKVADAAKSAAEAARAAANDPSVQGMVMNVGATAKSLKDLFDSIGKVAKRR